MFAPVVWCRCSYDGGLHLHGSWCATTREVGASQEPLATLAVVARGQHTEHSASDTTRRSSHVLVTYGDMEDEPQEGGAFEGGRWLADSDGIPYWSPTGEAGTWRDGGDGFVFDPAHEREADELPIGTATWYPRRLASTTWLASLPHRWPLRVVQ